MNLEDYTKKLCEEHGIVPARSKGQNFLVREEIYEQIIEAANIEENDIIIEVGPGLGFLTERLARRAKKVFAVELDDKLAGALRKRLDEFNIKNVEVLNMNVLDLDVGKLTEISPGSPEFSSFKIVANLPYNITSVFLRKFLSPNYELDPGCPEPSSLTLMLQKEVALRIAARPPKMSLLAISVQLYADPEIVEYVNRDCFWPEPEVDSCVIKLEVRSKKPEAGNNKDFFRLVKTGFSSKRKMLKNNLASGYQISNEEAILRIKKAGFSEKARAQELSVKDWEKLLGLFS